MSSHSYHIKAREALIAKDRGLRYDHIHPASDLERKADAVIRKIREIEAGTVWKREEEQLNHVFPGMGFLTGVVTLSLLVSRWYRLY
jgi:adenosine deaminase CECR1